MCVDIFWADTRKWYAAWVCEVHQVYFQVEYYDFDAKSNLREGRIEDIAFSAANKDSVYRKWRVGTKRECDRLGAEYEGIYYEVCVAVPQRNKRRQKKNFLFKHYFKWAQSEDSWIECSKLKKWSLIPVNKRNIY